MFAKLLNFAHVSLGYSVFMIHCTVISIPSLLCFESKECHIDYSLSFKKGNISKNQLKFKALAPGWWKILNLSLKFIQS